MTVNFVWQHSLCSPSFPEPAYEALRQSVAGTTPFNHLAWLRGAEQALGPGQRLHILLAWQGQRLLLCLPLLHCQERRLKLPLRVVRHLGYPLSDRLALLVDPASAAVLMPAALAQIRHHLPHALLQLSEVTPDAARQAALQHWGDASWYWQSQLACRTPEHRISDEDRQEVSGDVRYKLRKARKRCAAIGAKVVRVYGNEQDLAAIVQSIREVEHASWKGEQGVGIFSGERNARWMHDALLGLAATGRLRLLLLRDGERCISYRLGLLEDRRLYDYNLAFLPAYANLGSGRLLLDEWIAWGLEDGWQWIDASRVSLHHSSHQLHERQTGQIEHRRWNFYSWRPEGLLHGFASLLWEHLKPLSHRWRVRYSRQPQEATQ